MPPVDGRACALAPSVTDYSVELTGEWNGAVPAVLMGVRGGWMGLCRAVGGWRGRGLPHTFPPKSISVSAALVKLFRRRGCPGVSGKADGCHMPEHIAAGDGRQGR